MKRSSNVIGLILCAGLAAACGGASQAAEAGESGFGRVDRTLEAPAEGISGLAWGEGMLWAVDSPTGMVYSMDPMSGAVADSFRVSLNGGCTATGLAYSQEHDLLLVGLWDGGTNGWVGVYSPAGENLNNISMCGG
jgi:hypothetical protein